jgi:hypothetical protein
MSADDELLASTWNNGSQQVEQEKEFEEAHEEPDPDISETSWILARSEK